VIEDIVPSGSVAVKLTVTRTPVLTGFGEMLEMLTVGGWSFTVSVVVPDPGPALLVAVTVIVKICDLTLPVDA
jgi:hypothetical protein